MREGNKMRLSAKDARRLMEDRTVQVEIHSLDDICEAIYRDAKLGRGHLRRRHLKADDIAWLGLNGYIVLPVYRDDYIILWDNAQI